MLRTADSVALDELIEAEGGGQRIEAVVCGDEHVYIPRGTNVAVMNDGDTSHDAEGPAGCTKQRQKVRQSVFDGGYRTRHGACEPLNFGKWWCLEHGHNVTRGGVHLQDRRPSKSSQERDESRGHGLGLGAR